MTHEGNGGAIRERPRHQGGITRGGARGDRGHDRPLAGHAPMWAIKIPQRQFELHQLAKPWIVDPLQISL